MRYLFSVIDDRSNSATSEEMKAIDLFNDQLRAEGRFVFACGLGSPGESLVIDTKGESVVVNRGPLIDSKEFISGFWIVEAANLEEAQSLAIQGSRSCNRKVEVRPLIG